MQFLAAWKDPSGSIIGLANLLVLWIATGLVLVLLRKFRLIDFNTRFRKWTGFMLTPFPILIIWVIGEAVEVTIDIIKLF